MFDGEHTVHLLVNLLVNNRKNKAYCYLLIFTVVCIYKLKRPPHFGVTHFFCSTTYYSYLLIFTVVCILYTNLKASTRWGNTFFLFNNSAEHVILNVQYFNFT